MKIYTLNIIIGGMMFNEKEEKISDMAEVLYKSYVQMNNVVSNFEEMKYYNNDNAYQTEEFKKGFISGVKMLSSIIFFL